MHYLISFLVLSYFFLGSSFFYGYASSDPTFDELSLRDKLIVSFFAVFAWPAFIGCLFASFEQLLKELLNETKSL